MKNKIIDTDTEHTIPFMVVKASDEADAEIFAQEQADENDEYSYFKGMEAGAAQETSDGNYVVRFD